MLVLRRRPSESIVFDGGLKITVAALQDQRAWLRLEAPCMRTRVLLGVLSVGDDHACVGVAAPVHIGEPSDELEIETGERDDAVLLVNRRAGERLCFPDLVVTLEAVEPDRAVLGLDIACVAGRVTVSAFPATGAEVKIGIDAPREVRVFREEVWRELEAANTRAAGGWTDSDLASLTRSRPPGDGAVPAPQPAAVVDPAPSGTATP